MLEIAIENLKTHKSVEIICFGNSSSKAISDLKIHGTTVINFENGEVTELYRESYSIGSGIIGSRACRAKRFYYNQNEGKTYSQHTKNLSKTKTYIYENNQIIQSTADFEKEFNRYAGDIFMYEINRDTILSLEKPLMLCNKTKTYSFAFNLNPETSSIKAAKETVDTGGLKDVKHEKVTVFYVIDEHIKIVYYEIHCTYKIDTGIPIFGKQQVRAKLNQTIEYFDFLSQMPWIGE